MAVRAARVTVTTEATRLDVHETSLSRNTGSDEILVRNRGLVPVFLGGQGVTHATGFQLDAGDQVSMSLLSRGRSWAPAQGDTLFGIVQSGTAVCHVLQSGV